MHWLLLFPLILLASCASETTVQTAWQADPTTFEINEVARDLSIPWDLVSGPDGRLWFTEKSGWIKAVDVATKQVDTIHFIPNVFVSAIENSGLHSMCFHPNWPDTMAVFCHYSYDSLASKLVRFDYDATLDTFVKERAIFPSIAGARSHNGSRMVVADDGTILFSVGDAYQFQPAQDLNSLSGKILRFNPDGSCPADNPFEGKYAYTVGHRNPQGLTFGRNGNLYNSEHGTNANDELNHLKKGGNYGWPNVSGYCDLPVEKPFCDSVNVVEPLIIWTPTAAPSGLAFYDHDAIPEWKNCLLQAFLKDKSLCVLQLNENGDSITSQRRFFTNLFYRIRDVEVVEDGSIFVCSSNKEVQGPPSFPNDDKIYHIQKHQTGNGLQSVSINLTSEGLALSFSIPNEQAIVSLLTFYGGIEVEQEVNTASQSIQLDWKGGELEEYYLKIQLADGRTLIRRLLWR